MTQNLSAAINTLKKNLRHWGLSSGPSMLAISLSPLFSLMKNVYQTVSDDVERLNLNLLKYMKTVNTWELHYKHGLW